MSVDLNVRIGSENMVSSFTGMAEKLGFDYIIVTGIKKIRKKSQKRPSVLLRAELQAKTLNALRTQLNQLRKKATIIAVPLKEINIANIAAEDPRVDIITIRDIGREHSFKTTTAKIAASTDVALEIPIRPLIVQVGLERSKVLKVYREAVSTALKADMQVVLSSGAHHPMEMRAAKAFEFIGEVIGLDRAYIKSAMKWTKKRVKRNEYRISSEFIAPGIERVKGGKATEKIS